MRVLVTGAGGTLGLALAPALEQAGHVPVLQDVRDVDTDYTFVRGGRAQCAGRARGGARRRRDRARRGDPRHPPGGPLDAGLLPAEPHRHAQRLGGSGRRRRAGRRVQQHDGRVQDQLARDPMPVLDTYYPGASQLLRERGVDSLAPITVRYPMDHAKQVLGFEPECNVEQWLDQLSNRPDERAGTSPPWP